MGENNDPVGISQTEEERTSARHVAIDVAGAAASDAVHDKTIELGKRITNFQEFLFLIFS